MVVMLFVTRIVLQALGVVDYGIYNVIAGSISLLTFFRSSLAVTMQRFLNHYQGGNDFERQKQVFNIGIIFHWSVAFILLLLFVILSLFLFNGILNIPYERADAAKIVYVCLIVNTILTIVTAPYDATITAHENMLFYSIVGIIESFLKLGAALVVVYFGNDKLILYAILMMGVPLFETLMMRGYCKLRYSECSFHPRTEWNPILAKEMTKFAGLSLVGSSSSVIGNYGANVALNHFFGAAINAVAGIASQVQGVIAVLLNGLVKSLTPVIFKAEGEGSKDKMITMSMLGCKYSTLLYSLLAVPVFIQTPYLMKLWLGDVPEWTVIFVRLQLIRAYFEQLGASLTNTLIAANHIKEYNYLSCVYNLSPLIILIILYGFGFPPYWHYIIMIVVLVLGQDVTILILNKKYCSLHLTDYVKKVFVPCFLVTIISFFFGSITYFFDGGFISLILCAILTTSVFCIILWELSSNDERAIIRNGTRSLIRKIVKHE